MVDGEAQRLLRFIITLDHYLTGIPACIQAASCAVSTLRQPCERLRASAAVAAGKGSSCGLSARATAMRRSSSATCPATERQRQLQRKETVGWG